MIYLFFNLFFKTFVVLDICVNKKNMRSGFFNQKPVFTDMVLKEITKAIKDFLNENYQYFQIIIPKIHCLFNTFDDSTFKFSKYFYKKFVFY